jgi:UDP-N-acetylmuramyl pentapeptide synthase
MHWTVATLIEATGGRLLQGNPDRPIGGISTDTRAIRAGDCFVALRGERHDAHDFIPKALESGAEAAVIAWLRHQTTAYDSMKIPRIKGKRREVRRMLAQRSQELLGQYRRGETVGEECPLQRALTPGVGRSC